MTIEKFFGRWFILSFVMLIPPATYIGLMSLMLCVITFVSMIGLLSIAWVWRGMPMPRDG